MSVYSDIISYLRGDKQRVGGARAYANSYATSGAPTRTGEQITPDSALSNPTVVSCINVIADTIAQTDVSVSRKTENGYEAIPHPVSDILNRPNGLQTRSEFIHSVIVDILAHGNAFVLILGQGDNRQLVPLDPRNMAVVKNAAGRLVYQDTSEGAGFEAEYTQQQIIHFRDFATHEELGRSRVQMGASLIAQDNALRNLVSDVLKNGNAVSGVLSAPEGDITPDEATAIAENWQEKFTNTGSDRGGCIILSGGMQYTPINFLSVGDAQAIELEKQHRARICALFRVPVQFLELADNNKYNNVSQKKTGFYSDTLAPIIKYMEEKLTARLLRERDLCIKFDTTALLKGDLVTQAGVVANLVSTGILTPNEGREYLGYSRIDGEGADELASSPSPEPDNTTETLGGSSDAEKTTE